MVATLLFTYSVLEWLQPSRAHACSNERTHALTVAWRRTIAFISWHEATGWLFTFGLVDQSHVVDTCASRLRIGLIWILNVFFQLISVLHKLQKKLSQEEVSSIYTGLITRVVFQRKSLLSRNSKLRKPVGATVNIYFSDSRHLIIWRPPLNYLAPAT